MPHIILFLVTVCLALTLHPPSPGDARQWVAAAWADDDDDDDDGRRPRLRIIPRIVPAPQPQRQRRAPQQQPQPARVPNEILARGLDDGDLQALQGQGFRVVRSTVLANGLTMHRLLKPANLTMPEARRIVRMHNSAEAADFNHYFRAEAGPDCKGSNCPARQMIGWPVAMAGCGPTPRIGMIDTGLNAAHAVFQGSSIEVHRIGDEAAPSDLVHGTAVAALLVGRNDSRSPGLVPHATLIAVDAFESVGSDSRADAFALIEALDFLGQSDVGVINLSLAGPANEPLEFQIRELDRQGIVIVAAAGNNGPRAAPAYPAAYENVIAVTAVDRQGGIYRRAIRGGHIDLAAPGVEVWTAASVSGARTKTGTSFAAPFVSAAAALILQHEPGLSPAEVRRRLNGSARDLGSAGRDEIFGHGLVIPPNPCAGRGSAPVIVPASGN